MALNEQLVRTLRAVRDSLDSDGVSATSTRRALQAACNIERDAMIAAYANRITSQAECLCRHVTAYGPVPGIDRSADGRTIQEGWDEISADTVPEKGRTIQEGWDEISADTVPEKGRAVRSARKHAERNGMLPDPNAYP